MFEIGSVTHILLCLPIPFLFYFGTKIEHKDSFLVVSSLILFLLEMVKQIYSILTHTWTVWIFPFQLCSIPLYYFLFCHTRFKESFQSFIHDYILLAAIVALLYPQDMIHTSLFLTIHAFLWHYILILMASIQSNGSFKQSTQFFFITCILATLFNILLSSYGEINCFYISCIYPSSQPVFSSIGKHFGILVQVLSYTLTIIVGSFLVKQLRKFLKLTVLRSR